eukprot:SAG11_NODE_40026_length_213_cov_210.271930_1_plen_40_part_01
MEENNEHTEETIVENEPQPENISAVVETEGPVEEEEEKSL